MRGGLGRIRGMRVGEKEKGLLGGGLEGAEQARGWLVSVHSCKLSNMAAHTSYWAVWMQRAPRVQSTTDTPGILKQFKYTAAGGANINAAASL